MNWEKNFDKHINKTIKNIDKYEIDEKNKIFLKTSFLLGDTTLRIFVISILDASGTVISNETGWAKKLKKLPVEGYQEALSILLFAYVTNRDDKKDYSELFNPDFIIAALNLERFKTVRNLPRHLLDIVGIDINIDNDFVNSTINHLVGEYLERMDKVLLRILNEKNAKTNEEKIK